VALLLALIDTLALGRPVLVAPSTSGRYALPAIIGHPERFAGLVAAAPVGVAELSPLLERTPLPVLGIWGQDDAVVPVTVGATWLNALTNGQLVVLPGVGHTSYLEATDDFHAALLRFARAVLTD